MKIDEIKSLTPDQRQDELVKLKKEQFNLRFQRASGQLENTARVRTVRRTIARILTMENKVENKVENKLENKKQTTKTKVKEK